MMLNNSDSPLNATTVSLVIPMLNEAAGLPALLRALQEQVRLPDEIIFVDAGSTDGGPRIITDWWNENSWPTGSCRVESNPGGYPGHNRNVGVHSAFGDWIALIDCGIYPAADWLAQLLNHALQTKAAAVFGMCEFVATGHVARSTCALGYGFGSVHPVLPASLFRRAVFTAVGMFEEDLRAGEDIEWMARLTSRTGPKVVCRKALVQYSIFPTSLVSVAKKNYLYQLSALDAGVGRKVTLVYLVGAAAVVACVMTIPASVPWLAVAYVVARGVIDPIRRSRQRIWWGGQPLSMFVSPIVALITDAVKLVAILRSLLPSKARTKGADSES
jgi:glycosyltransferase involved in cell wall biosynthesis